MNQNISKTQPMPPRTAPQQPGGFLGAAINTATAPQATGGALPVGGGNPAGQQQAEYDWQSLRNAATGFGPSSTGGVSAPTGGALPVGGGVPGTQQPQMPASTAPQPYANQPANGAQSPNPYSTGPTGVSNPMQPMTPDGSTSTGGVSAVNPQASAYDYEGLKRFEDAAYDEAMQRLAPQLNQQSDKFDQMMVNRGIPIGSEAYQEAKQQLDFNQNDARQSAAFNAMGFGRDTQNQMFGQDATRSQLANSLLQAQMGNELGYAGLNEQGRQFDTSFGENQRQFNDNSNYRWDRAQMNDMGWLANFDRENQRYNDQQDWNFFNANQGLLGAIPGWNPAQIDVNGATGAATNSQNAAFNAQNQMNQQAWSQITDVMGMGAMAMGSDERLKDNITKIGEINGQNIYRWTWNKVARWLGIGKQPTIGVIAQETPPEYVSVRDGYLAVNYEDLFNATA